MNGERGPALVPPEPSLVTAPLDELDGIPAPLSHLGDVIGGERLGAVAPVEDLSLHGDPGGWCRRLFCFRGDADALRRRRHGHPGEAEEFLFRFFEIEPIAGLEIFDGVATLTGGLVAPSPFAVLAVDRERGAFVLPER